MPERHDHWDEFFKSMNERPDKDDYKFGFSAVTSASSGFGHMDALTIDELRERVERYNMPVVVPTMPHITIRVYSKHWYPEMFKDKGD